MVDRLQLMTRPSKPPRSSSPARAAQRPARRRDRRRADRGDAQRSTGRCLPRRRRRGKAMPGTGPPVVGGHATRNRSTTPGSGGRSDRCRHRCSPSWRRRQTSMPSPTGRRPIHASPTQSCARPMPTLVIEAIDRYVGAGFDTVYLHQIGPDQGRLHDLLEHELCSATTPAEAPLVSTDRHSFAAHVHATKRELADPIGQVRRGLQRSRRRRRARAACATPAVEPLTTTLAVAMQWGTRPAPSSCLAGRTRRTLPAIGGRTPARRRTPTSPACRRARRSRSDEALRPRSPCRAARRVPLWYSIGL